MPETLASTSKLFEYQQAMLTQEIEYIRGQISAYDTLSFQIKGWSVTIWAAIIAFGSSQQVSVVVLASVPVVLTFWMLDALFKQYQRRMLSRMSVIEAFLDSSGVFLGRGLREAFAQQDFGDFPLQDPICQRTNRLYSHVAVMYRSNTRFIRAVSVPNVACFYLLLLVSSIVIGFALLL